MFLVRLIVAVCVFIGIHVVLSFFQPSLATLHWIVCGVGAFAALWES